MTNESSLWSRLWLWIGKPFRFQRAVSNELLVHEWTTLESLWQVSRQEILTANSTELERIDALFLAKTSVSDAEGWSKLNEAEQRVGAYLTAKQLPIEFAGLMQIAVGRSLQSLAVHKNNQTLFTDAAKLDEQRSAHAALLHDLQSDFINTRFRRELRSEVAQRLFYYGVGTVLLAIVAPLLLVWNHLHEIPVDQLKPTEAASVMTRFSSEPIFALTMVATFGILGAYFSRAIAFQGSIATMSFDDVMTMYIGRMLRMRLLYGMIGAIIFYFVLRGNLLAGSIFPELQNIGIGEQIVWKLTDGGLVRGETTKNLSPAGLTVLAPTLDMAKLIVWSFIAGFSERLVPDALARTEAQGTRSNT